MKVYIEGRLDIRNVRLCSLLLGLWLILPGVAPAAPGRVLMASSFQNRLGTWQIINYPGSLSGQILFGQIDSNPSDTSSAIATADIPATGQYRVWVRCREFLSTQPGVRFFNILLGAGLYNERFADEGLHDGLGWEDGGIVNLTAGPLPVQITDSSACYARFDALLLTPDLGSSPPPDTQAGVQAIADLVNPLPPAQATTNLLVMPTSFANRMGGWQLVADTGSLTGQILFGHTNRIPAATRPAEVTVEIPKTDLYRVWVRCRDFTTPYPGARFFNVRLGDGIFDERFAETGSHHGYAWEMGGTVTLPAGSLKIELLDTSAFYARFDAIFLTNDLILPPPSVYGELLQIATLIEPQFGDTNTQPPDWATSQETPQAEAEIGNSLVRVRFFQTPSGTHTIIQKQTSVFVNGAWYPIGGRTELFAYVALYAKASSVAGDFDFASYNWHSVVQGPDGPTTVTTGNIFESGELKWLVPSQMRKIDGKTMQLTAAADLTTLTVTWTTPDGASEPVVQCDLEAGRTGSWSLGMSNGPETEFAGVNYVLCPKPYLGKHIPPIPLLVRENASPNATSLMTLPLAAPIAGQNEISYGITPDPSSVPYRWANERNSLFGLGIRGPLGGVGPWLFAPLPAGDGSFLTAGQVFSFKYRPLLQLGGWKDLYRHLAGDILNVRDVKKNYYSSLTDAIFNVQELILADSRYSGWSDRAMAFSYAEMLSNTINNFNHSSPLTLVQNYLFTEDRNWYIKRTIPTMAYNLSRPGWTNLPTTAPLVSSPAPLGGMTSWPSSVSGGFYLMSQGRTPAYRAAGFQNAITWWHLTRTGSNNTHELEFMEQLNRYRFTQAPALLTAARAGADQYLANVVNWTPNIPIAGVGFEILTTAPWVPAMLSMYEVTGDSKYLDAADASARKLLANSTWVQPKVPDGNVLLKADTLKAEGFFHDPEIAGSSVHGWNGDVRMILGYLFPNGPYTVGAPIKRTPGAFGNLLDETVPAWLLSRVGRNMEHAPQLARADGFRSPNINMTCYTADFVRLAKYTGDKIYETVARHDTIGLAANYPGYYMDRMMTNTMKPNYPYEGPDVSCIEYTHIPPYLAKIEDFLITTAWAWSDKQIEFPWIRQYSYAYFDNKVYGFAPGRFFDHDGMWIWLKRGLINVNNVQIDWLGARKNGLFAAALMNEDDKPVAVTVTLGSEVTGGNPFTGSATIYGASGQKSTVAVYNSRFTVTVPSKGLVGFTVQSAVVREPRFAGSKWLNVNETDPGRTVALPQGASDFGTGYVLQIDPGSYFAYTFLPYTPSAIQSATLHYRIGNGEWRTVILDDYPYESIQEVAQVNQPFIFYWDMIDSTGKSKQSAQKQLEPLHTSGVSLPWPAQ